MNSSQREKTLYLIDGTALAYRSYFAFIKNPLINSKGMNTSGVYGFTAGILRLIKQEHPDLLGCVFDMAAPTFRHRLYPEYKATREKMPDEMVEQLPYIRSVVQAFGIPLLELETYEADDIMGTLAKQAEARGYTVYLVTGDKDLMQLVTPNIFLYSLRSRSAGEPVDIFDEKRVEQKLGVPPAKVTDLLGLMGDTSDNVPGIPGVGPKTAVKLIQEYGSLEQALEQIDSYSGKSVREKVSQNRESALLSKELVTIDTNVPVSFAPEDLRFSIPDHTELRELFTLFEFRKFIKELESLEGSSESAAGCAESDKTGYAMIRSLQEVRDLAAVLAKAGAFALDLETTSLDPLNAEIVGLSFSWKQGEAAYIPVMGPDEQTASLTLFMETLGTPVSEVLAVLRPVLENPGIGKFGQNIKYDWHILERYGIRLAGVVFDTMVAAYLINPSARTFNIDTLAKEYLNIEKIPTKDLIGTGRKQITMDRVDLEQICSYACEDADAAFRLKLCLEPKLKDCGMESLFSQVEMKLVRVLMEMEQAGVGIDTGLLDSMSRSMEERLKQIRAAVYADAGEEFNINSTQQLGHILFEKLEVHRQLGIKRIKKTKTGYSTDVSVLESLSAHPIAQKLLEYRQLSKLKSTYIDAIPGLVNGDTGRVHASFNQTVTATGRISSSSPNLQNIPIRTDLGREIRKAFVPGRTGWIIMSADYSQIELRIMAHLSGDETLRNAFVNREDVHSRTAADIFSVPIDGVSPDMRRKAKEINFGIMYGMGAYGLARRLQIPVKEAEQFIAAYFARYPRVNEFMTATISKAYSQGFVTTLLNRRRYLPELKSTNGNIRQFGERTAINTPIQGTAADLIKVAMIRIAEKLRLSQWQASMILQIHDELLFEAPEQEAEDLRTMIKQEMEHAIDLSVPVYVDIGTGENWYEAH